MRPQAKIAPDTASKIACELLRIMARGLSFVSKCFGSFTERKCYRHNKFKICQTTRASYTAIDSRRADKVRLWRGAILARCDFGAVRFWGGVILAGAILARNLNKHTLRPKSRI